MALDIFKPYRVVQADLVKVPCKAGQLIFTTDTKRIYIDISDAESGRLLASADSFIDVTLGNDKRSLTFTKANGQTEVVTIVVDIDDAFDEFSLNPIQNAVVSKKIDEILDLIADDKEDLQNKYNALVKQYDDLEALVEQNTGNISKHDQAIESINSTLDEVQSDVSTNYNESIISLSVDGQTVTYIKGDGSTHSFTTQDTDTTYSLGTDQVTGLTKLYATTGSAEDGTMTQRAIKTELDKKVGVSIQNDTLIFTI